MVLNKVTRSVVQVAINLLQVWIPFAKEFIQWSLLIFPKVG